MEVVLTLGGFPMWPQLSLQTMIGVGTPIASHSIVMLLPCCACAVGGGGLITVGEAVKRYTNKH